MVVPLAFFPTFPPFLRFLFPLPAVNFESGVALSNTPGTPRWNEMVCIAPSRATTTSIRSASALTTDAPTPCRPPEAA